MAVQLNRRHNETVLRSLREGDQVEFKRGLYSHWGVFIGSDQIVHLAGEDNDGIDANIQASHLFTFSGVRVDKARVCIGKFWSVVGEDKAYRQNDKDHVWRPFAPHEIVAKALRQIGQVGYNILYENCEHFAKWCRYGIAKSDQVDNVLTGVAVGFAAALAVGIVHGVAKGKEEKRGRGGNIGSGEQNWNKK